MVCLPPPATRIVLGTKHRLIRLIRNVLLACLATSPRALSAADVVVNHSVPESELTRNVARLVFTMRLLRWQDGNRVRVFVLPDSHAVHRDFAKHSLELYPRQLRRVWDRHLFSGSGPVPVQVDSVEEMARLVAETPGAIGYLPDGLARETVRVIHVK